jgi:hypothetical protein
MGKYDDILTAVGRAAPPPKYIRAYHGSPHSLDRFDSRKIGTGYGAQAQGYGLYFAGAEDRAKTYRNPSGASRDVYVDGSSVMDLDDALKDGPAFGTPRSPESAALRALRQGAYGADDAEQALANARMIVSDNSPDRVAAISDALERLAKGRIELGQQPGHMYEVELRIPEQSLLDLDAPVMQQPQEIQKALGPYAEAPGHFYFGQEGWTGRNAYMQAAEAGVGGGMPQASKQLLRQGVPGLRYLDAPPTTAGAHNYVMFPGTEDSIRILRKYGLLAPMAAGAMGEQE